MSLFLKSSKESTSNQKETTIETRLVSSQTVFDHHQLSYLIDSLYLVSQSFKRMSSFAYASSPAYLAAPSAYLDDSPAASWASQALLPAAPVAAAALPPIDYSCYREPQVAPGVTRYIRIQDPTEVRELSTVDGDVQTVVRENNHHVYFNKTIITQVNRNHLHTQRVITNENNYNTYVTNYVTRVNDIHQQRVEHVPGERRVFNSYKQSQQIEPARCLRADGSPCLRA